MASYVYTASGSATASANIATDKVRIATTGSAIQFVASYPNVAGNGTVVAATNSATLTGTSSAFLSQIGVGYWIGNATGTTVGIVDAIANNTSLTLTANAAVAIAGAGYTYNPHGVPFSVVDANSQIVPANTVLNSVYVGQGNVVSFLDIGGGSASEFSITELGMPYPNTGTSGVNPPPASGGPLS